MVSFGWSQLKFGVFQAKFRIGKLILREYKNIYNVTFDHIYLTFVSPINHFFSLALSAYIHLE